MAEYDLVIRNTTIATAADAVKGDIGVTGGRVVALGERLDKGRREIDATALIAVPGGIAFDAAGRVDFNVVGWEGPDEAWLRARNLLPPRPLGKRKPEQPSLL